MSLRSDIAKEIAPLLAEIRDLSTAHAPTLAMIDALMAQIPAKAASAALPVEIKTKPKWWGVDFSSGGDWAALTAMTPEKYQQEYMAHPSPPPAVVVQVWENQNKMTKTVGVKLNSLPKGPLAAEYPLDYMTLAMNSPSAQASLIGHAAKVCADKIGHAVKQAIEDGVIESLLHKPAPVEIWPPKIEWGKSPF